MIRHKKHKWICLLSVNFLALFFTYHFFLLPSYTSDHINAYLAGKQFISNEIVFGNRALSTLIAYVWDSLFGFSIATQPYVQFICIMLMSVSVAITVDLLYKAVFSIHENFDVRKAGFINIAVLLAFVNPVITEMYVFPGLEWHIGILLAVFAAKSFCTSKYVQAFLLLLACIFVYQSFFAIFLGIVLTHLFLNLLEESPKFTLYWKKTFFAIVFIGVAAVINLLYVKILLWTGVIAVDVKSTQLVSSSNDVQTRVLEILNWMKKIFGDCYGLMPRWLMVIFMSTVALCIIVGIFKKWKEPKVKLTIVIAFGLTLGACFFSVFLVSLLQGSGAYLPQRVVFPSFLGLTSLAVIAFKILSSVNLPLHKLCICLASIFLMISYHYTQISILDFYTTNTLDRYYMDSVQQTIERYEEKTGINVTTIYAGRTDTSAYLYNYLHMPNDSESYSHKMPYYFWSDVELLNYFANESYVDKPMSDSIYEQYFANRNWDVFVPDEQMIFENDVVYWVVY